MELSNEGARLLAEGCLPFRGPDGQHMTPGQCTVVNVDILARFWLVRCTLRASDLILNVLLSSCSFCNVPQHGSVSVCLHVHDTRSCGSGSLLAAGLVKGFHARLHSLYLRGPMLGHSSAWQPRDVLSSLFACPAGAL